jgi:hypothetical protein
VSKALYDDLRASNETYRLKQRLCPTGKELIYAPYSTPEPFITDMKLSEKDAKAAASMAQKLAIPPGEAEEILLARTVGGPLVITNRQVWLEAAAKKAGVKAETFK